MIVSSSGHKKQARSGHYGGSQVEDPDERDETSDSRPTFDLDDGKTDGIVLVNALDVAGFLIDEFGGTNFPLINVKESVSSHGPPR